MNEIIFFYIDFLTEIVFKLDPFPIIDVFIINILFVPYGLWFKLKPETITWLDFVECPNVQDEKIQDLEMDLMESAMV